MDWTGLWSMERKRQRKQTEHHIPVNSLPEEERFARLRTERKHFLDLQNRLIPISTTSAGLKLSGSPNTIPDGAQRWANELRRRNRGGVVNDTPAGSGLPE